LRFEESATLRGAIAIEGIDGCGIISAHAALIGGRGEVEKGQTRNRSRK
jgi:hypothetical protein